MSYIKVLYGIFIQFIQILPMSVIALVAKFSNIVPSLEETLVDHLLEKFNFWVKLPEFKQIPASEKLSILTACVDLELVPLLFFPTIKSNIRSKAIKLIDHKLKWQFKTNGK